ncbi:GNAT family N-acetyltransferase [Deinococcus cellulosilyticus]|nr:GNAT family N-acetyltransferase [Deinococcus cellulosilyticus]
MNPMDEPQIQQLIEEVWHGDSDVLPYFRRSGSTQFHVVFETAGKIAGYGSLTECTLHPVPFYVGLHVHPAHRRQGVGHGLLVTLLQKNGGFQGRPLQSATYRHLPEGIQALQHLGFHETLSTWTGELQIREIMDRIPPPEGFQLGSLADLGQEWVPVLTALHQQIYLNSHGHNPSVLSSAEVAQARFMGGDLISKLMWVAMHNDQPRALGSFRATDDQDLLEMGWFGSAGLDPELEEALLLSIFSHAAWQAHQMGFQRLQGEFDSGDASLAALRHAFPWKVLHEWVTFQQKRTALFTGLSSTGVSY